MYFDPKIDSIEDVLAIRKAAMDMLKAGVVTMTWNIGGNSQGRQFVLPVKAVLQETAAFLRIADPCRYSQFVNRRTMPLYTQF